MPSSAASAVIASILRWNEKLASPMDSSKCFATLLRADNGAAPAAQWMARPPNGGGDDGEIGFGRRQQVLALARALAREIGIAADDQPLARIVGRRDRSHVTLGEQTPPQR